MSLQSLTKKASLSLTCLYYTFISQWRHSRLNSGVLNVNARSKKLDSNTVAVLHEWSAAWDGHIQHRMILHLNTTYQVPSVALTGTGWTGSLLWSAHGWELTWQSAQGMKASDLLQYKSSSCPLSSWTLQSSRTQNRIQTHLHDLETRNSNNINCGRQMEMNSSWHVWLFHSEFGRMMEKASFSLSTITGMFRKKPAKPANVVLNIKQNARDQYKYQPLTQNRLLH